MTGHREEIGRRLREARQSAGLSLDEISQAIRVRSVYLTAIEAGEFERLPALPQTVGFTRAYAQHLSVDLDGPLSALGEEVHRHIDSADYSDPEPVWTVSPRRVSYVSAGVLLGAALLGLYFIDFSEERYAPSADGALPGPAVTGSTPIERTPLQPTSPYAERTEATEVSAPAASTASSAPVSAALHEQMTVLLAGQADISSVNEATEPPAAATAADSHFVSGDVYLRSEPANSGVVVGVLKGCEAVTLADTDARGQWLRVGREDGSSGWVYGAFIRAEKPARCS